MPIVQLSGCTLHYELIGAGSPAVLFIHGYSCAARDWRLQTESLSASLACIALDLRGHGRSSAVTGDITMGTFASDAIALMDVLEIDCAVLVGHSMGTRIALEAALRAPERVAGLVLVDGSKVEASPEVVRISISEAIAEKGFAGWTEQNMGAMFLDKLQSEDRDLILQRAIGLGSGLGLQLYVSMTTWDQERLAVAADKVAAPISVIQSTSILPGEARTRCYVDEAPNSPWLNIWRAQGRAQIVMLPQTGHFAMLERPGEVNTAISELVSQI